MENSFRVMEKSWKSFEMLSKNVQKPCKEIDIETKY